MTLRVDYSAETGAVVVCTECPEWFAFRFTRRDGWAAARDHEQRVHPGARQASNALAHHDGARRVSESVNPVAS
ncbi:hypothetical protein [Microbacterium sp. No. 7]|uniref:hypothetical protein n=1 Tax=Microbacterium sp. No. 7 TaxID=1714373 RepID=UPI0006D291A0|nr:hypothetical protein [Microbacterium sp. No. 7]ALJ20314.1 hypothetical protein AOA12_10480 [Microbacterium sp. No. 7]